jgi:hypothetical protein
MRPIAIGAIVALLLVAGAAGYYFLTLLSPADVTPESTPPTTQPSPVTAQPSQPPAQPPPSDEPPASFEEKIQGFIEELQEASTAGESTEITLVITEDEANSNIAPLLAQVEIPEDIPLEVESIHIDFQPGIVATELRGTTYGITLTIQVEARVHIEDGKPRVEVVDINLGWLPLPQLVKDQITGLITQKIEELQTEALNQAIAAIGDVDWEVTRVDIQETQVTVSLLIKPKTS